MKNALPRPDVVRVIRLAAFLLIGYSIALFFYNRISQGVGINAIPQPPQRPFPPQAFPPQGNNFYISLYGCIAVVCLVLAYWPWVQARLRRWFVPVIIAIVTISPIIINQVTGSLTPLGSRFSSPEATALAMFPFLFVGLLLVAWQYKWPYILLITLGIAAVNLGVRWPAAEPGSGPFQGVLAVTLIQTVTFLVVGFSISYLMSRLRAQQRSLEAANTQLTRYAGTLEQLATSRERNRLALELHDTLAHTLSGLSVQLETVKAYWDVDRPAARSVLEKSLAATHTGLEETRRALKALRASPLDDLGLVPAIRKLAEDAAARAGLVLDMPEVIMVPPISPEVEQYLYRVAQEALANVVKHASAKKLTVRLGFPEGGTNLVVSDDGVGFDLTSLDKQNHFGLAGIRERAAIVGGELNITSRPGAGTTVNLLIRQETRP